MFDTNILNGLDLLTIDRTSKGLGTSISGCFNSLVWVEHSLANARFRVSNTLITDFCKEAVQEAINRYGKPEIFNTDQGYQFTSLDFTGLLKDNGIQISMDGKGCWRDNVFVEWLWKSVKYEEVSGRSNASVGRSKSSIGSTTGSDGVTPLRANIFSAKLIALHRTLPQGSNQTTGR